MKLSILIPTVPSRKSSLRAVLEKLESQPDDGVHIITLYDNKRWTVGAKRNKLLHLADSEYVCFIDDDDEVSKEYVGAIIEATESKPDLITFNVRYTSDKGEDYICKYGEGQRPAHVHVWRNENLTDFPETNVGEDTRWVKNNLSNVTNVVHIEKTLYHYKFNSKNTETQK